MNAILVQIRAIEQHSIESSRRLTGFDLSDLHTLAAALEAAAEAIRAEAHSRLCAPLTGGLLAGLLRPSSEGGAA